MAKLLTVNVVLSHKAHDVHFVGQGATTTVLTSKENEVRSSYFLEGIS